MAALLAACWLGAGAAAVGLGVAREKWAAVVVGAFAVAYGLAAVAGHVRPVFLKFGKGGKGVATATGVFAGLAPIPMLITFAIFVVVVLASGYVSLGSLISAVILPAVLLYTAGPASPIFVVSVVLAGFVFWTHRANIGRLRRGEEHRFGKRAAG